MFELNTLSSRVAQFSEQLNKIPILKRTSAHIHQLHRRFGEEYVELAESVLEKCEVLGWNACKILTNVFIECLQEMSAFLETGEFGHNFDEAQKNVYENAQYMENEYLPGLFIAYAFTPLLFPKYPFFRKNFCSRLNADMKGCEVGFGDGFYLWVLCKAISGIRPCGFDISPSAIEVTTKVLNSSGFDGFSLKLGNILEGLVLPAESQDYGILAEVIEHIPNPERGINEMARILRPGGLLYLSTTKDYNHPDHITNFPSVEYVVELISKSGFNVIESMSYCIQDDYPESPDKSVNMAFICERK
jgi:ubiquinone/menaquinone biosynthesis C-methylase UbiE